MLLPTLFKPRFFLRLILLATITTIIVLAIPSNSDIRPSLTTNQTDDYYNGQDDYRPGYFRNPKGNLTFKNSDPHSKSHTSQKTNENRDIDGTLSFELTNQQTFSSADIQIGSNQDKVTVIVSTGSSDFWVVDSNNPYCFPPSPSARDPYRPSFERGSTIDEDVFAYMRHLLSEPKSLNCSQYGTFNASNSITFHHNNTAFALPCVDNVFVNGSWGYDDVVINGMTIRDVPLGVADQTNLDIGVLGLGYQNSEATYDNENQNVNVNVNENPNPNTYENFPMKLKSSGIIKKVAYSVYLNDASTGSGAGRLLFGGVDHKKHNTRWKSPVVPHLQCSTQEQQ
ncbi:unnamed protein product [Ambrosiozyma monospora]|uniref:Unnamed protein product n=1 Tax=Ambrosiozyma monospora TaxID=43982 RepID=A0ACB5T6Q4_AMBMO|nr:unnamed protein product [Ambrosiozyma monospora]